jgi:7-cyano-7-deazaguanine synthase
MKEKAMVLLSGGLDSAVSLFWALSQGWEIRTIELDYYRRPRRESMACKALRERGGIDPAHSMIIPVDFIREIVDISEDTPVNHLLLQSPRGYIPARNLVFYSLCAHYAEMLGVRYIVGGHNKADSEVFPDAGMDFFRQFNTLLRSAIWSYKNVRTEIILPLIHFRKSEVVSLGHSLGVPFEMTWSCYDDGASPCRSCKSCTERGKAFEATGLHDPLE